MKRKNDEGRGKVIKRINNDGKREMKLEATAAAFSFLWMKIYLPIRIGGKEGSFWK